MEISRTQPFPLTFTQSGFEADTEYVLCILDDHAVDLVEIISPSDSDGIISIDLPNYFSRYDDEYRGEIYYNLSMTPETTILRGDLVWVDTITVMRPYVSPLTIAETPEDIANAVIYEEIARAIINSITGGFMYKREVVEAVGLGNDYLSVPFRLNRIVRVYENDVIVYDTEPDNPETWTNVREYYISPDKGTITMSVPNSNGINRNQSKPVNTRRGASDSFTVYNTNDSPNFAYDVYDNKTFSEFGTSSSMFPSGWDYVVVVEAGWPIIPLDIKRATRLIINDLKCNNIPYTNSYIKDYKSDQFTLKFDDRVFSDTGNRIADKILSAYVRPIYRIGVL
jgi:hypothetical protein